MNSLRFRTGASETLEREHRSTGEKFNYLLAQQPGAGSDAFHVIAGTHALLGRHWLRDDTL